MKKILHKSLCRLQALLLLLVMFVAGGSAVWAEEIVFSASECIGNYSVNKDGVSISFSSISNWNAGSFNYFEIPSGATWTVTSTSGNIASISVNGYSGYTGFKVGSTTCADNGYGSSSWTAEDAVTTVTCTCSGKEMDIKTITIELEPNDGSVKSTFNFNQASVPFVSSTGVAGNLSSGNRPSVGDVFTAPSGGATLTFNYVGESWSNSGQRLRLGSDASFTIAAPEGFEMTKIEFTTDTNTMTFSSKSGLTGNGSTKATWEGKSESETFTISANSWIQNIKVTMMPVAEAGEITYTIDLVDAPVGAYVTLDGQTFDSNNTYTVEKSLGKNDLVAYEPNGYYAEVEYTRDNHTYTVTYKAYNYYDVTVTGTTEAGAGVVYNNQTYGNGVRIESKDVLTESNVTAAEVSGMKGTVSMSGNTFNVDYQEKLDFVIMTNTGLTTYTNDEFKVTVTGVGTMGNCINLWSTWKATVTSEIFPIERIELEEGRNNYVITATSDPVGYNNMVWTGTPTNKVTFTAAGGDWEIKSVHVYLYKPQPVNYTFEFVNAPDEAYITIDGQTINKVNDGYTVAKVFTAESVTSVYEPDGYYADVEYNEENHKFTITYHQGSYVSFGNSWEQKEEITYDPYWSGGSVYQTSWDGYGRVFFRCSTKKITKIELRFDGDASPIIDGNGFGSVTANGNTAIWTAPAEGTATDICIYSTSSDGRNVVSSKVFYEALPDIDYPVVIAVDGTLPADFTPSVTVDGENFTESGTHSTPKTLTGSEASATTPDNGDWYYDVAYAEDTHTFTVTYKEYLHYIVSVEGCDDETAGVRMDHDTYHNGDMINVKEALTAEALTAVTVNGYDVTTPVVGDGTVTVTYSIAGLVDYAVTITGMPEGTSVKIEDEVFDADIENGVHQSNKTLSSDVVTIQNCPETHYTNESYEWYSEEDKAFNIEFTPYLVYSVAIDEASAYKGADAGVKVFNANTYLLGQPIYNKTALSESDVKATDVEGYTGYVTLADNVFTVFYTKNDFILFDASKFSQDGGYGSLDEPIEDVRLQCWDSGDYFSVNSRSNSHITLSSSDAPIVKVEAEYISWGKPSYGYATIDGKNTGELNTEADLTVWMGSTNNLELWDSTNNTAYVSSIKVYLAHANEYHVNIAGMPAGDDTYVVINNDYDHGKYTESGNYTYTTFDELGEYSLNLWYPDSYKGSKTYDAATKTYNVTYTARTQYSVVADVENAYTDFGAGIRVKTGEGEYDYNYYELGSIFYVDGTLDVSTISVRSVDGYDGTFVLDNDADPKTITVKYAEKDPVNYTVVFTGIEIPEDASVTITDADGDHVISNADADKTFASRYNCTEASAKAKQFEYYEASVALEGTTFTVTYNKVDYIYVDLTGEDYSEEPYIHESSEGTVSVSFYAYNDIANLYSGWPITVTSNTENIMKIEYVLDNGYNNTFGSTDFNFGAWTTDWQVWEANGAKTKTVTVTPSQSGNVDVAYTAVKVYIEQVEYGAPASALALDDSGFYVGTYYADYAWTTDEDALVYVVTGIGANNQLQTQLVTGVVPANTGALLYTHEANNNIVIKKSTEEVAPIEGNLLDGTVEATDGVGGDGATYYLLSKKSGRLGFYWDPRTANEGATLNNGAHKAYLRIPAASESNKAAAYFFDFGEGTLTGIDAVSVDANDAIFNLQGKRVSRENLPAGVYVKDGKKFIVK